MRDTNSDLNIRKKPLHLLDLHTWIYLEKLIKASVEMLTTPQKNPRHPYILQPRNKMEAIKGGQPVFVQHQFSWISSIRIIRFFNDISFMMKKPIKMDSCFLYVSS